MAEAITTADRIDTESDMLPQEPPPWVIRFAARLLIGLFTVALLAAIIVKLPETVNCAFILVPKEGADPIQSPRVAVMHRIGVTEGQTINQGTGDVRPAVGRDPRASTRSFAARRKICARRNKDMAKADAAYASQMDIKLAEISQAESEVKFRESTRRRIASSSGAWRSFRKPAGSRRRVDPPAP
jgi:hypothetical protein